SLRTSPPRSGGRGVSRPVAHLGLRVHVDDALRRPRRQAERDARRGGRGPALRPRPLHRLPAAGAPRPGAGEPRLIDWRLHGTQAALPAAFNWNDDLAGFEADPARMLESQAPVLRLVSNQRLTPAALRAAPHRAAALGLTPEPRLHARLFEALFRPSPAFAARLRARRLPEGRRIGIHFRAGDQMPQRWADPPRHALGEIDEFLDCAATLEAALGWEATFLLFADTDRVLEAPRVAALRAQGKLVWPAQSDNLIHLDRPLSGHALGPGPAGHVGGLVDPGLRRGRAGALPERLRRHGAGDRAAAARGAWRGLRLGRREHRLSACAPRRGDPAGGREHGFERARARSAGLLGRLRAGSWRCSCLGLR
ncbi:unnamed protein product, partial [Prorocentrum cordatum]